MVAMYIRGIDFCLANDYPSNDYIRQHFKGVMEDQGIFLDDPIKLTNYRRCIALGSCHGELLVSKYNVSEVFAKHDSQLDIIVEDNAFVEIDMFDNSRVKVTSRGQAKVHINVYGGELLIDEQDESRIKVVDKDSKTY